jgi:hypothetical protein
VDRRIQAGAFVTIYLRQLGSGVRFVLCRSGQKFLLVRRETVKGRREIVVQLEGVGRKTTLHHSCHVKPLVRA